MVFTGYLIPLLTLSTQALASYTGNLNYRHARLGIDLEKVTARSLSKRDEAPYTPSQLNFTHGVASGDPYADSVILWTRVAPRMQSDESDVTVSGDVPLYNHETERFVEAKGLDPFTTYYYQFNALNEYFNVYGNVVRKDNVDYVVHLGDYIYEYGFDAAEYRTDFDLAASHQHFARIPVWDDHEIANNGYRDGSSGLNNTEYSFLNVGPQVSVDQRKMNAVRAYFEWMPIRQVDMDDGLRIWRSFQMGNLMDLIMLDTRNYNRSITSLEWNDDYIERIQNDTGRSLMGARQENWLYRQLSDSVNRGTTWRVIGSQLRFPRLEQEVDGEVIVNLDSWDGYRANYNRTPKHMYDNNIGNNIMLAGYTHTNWVSDLAWIGEKSYDSAIGEGAVGVEFAGTAVSSEGFGGTISSAEAEAGTYKKNEEMRWTEGYYRGYYELHVKQDEVFRAGENHLARPVAGGEVEAGYFRDGQVKHSNLTLNTETGKWETIGLGKMFLKVEA
ncbi:hypothetical protein SI65_01357 [Aspergillus cristatus]|uniref:PhoD-like phosphatase metallophosphatase domain-containing protein n=1 Tax=Aspergillus cristatus TaxID=573508 RepID=A0A1E3BS37_ASPCR|nr:hypothetical protein SI65_01357 [Aspergillus cristatus]